MDQCKPDTSGERPEDPPVCSGSIEPLPAQALSLENIKPIVQLALSDPAHNVPRVDEAVKELQTMGFPKDLIQSLFNEISSNPKQYGLHATTAGCTVNMDSNLRLHSIQGDKP
jgi:hypothetical protein